MPEFQAILFELDWQQPEGSGFAILACSGLTLFVSSVSSCF